MQGRFFKVVLSGLLAAALEIRGADAGAPVSPIEITGQKCSDRLIEEVRVTVTPDIHPPRLDLAVAQEQDATNGISHIVVTFNEPVLRATATNPANYSVRAMRGASPPLTVSRAEVNGPAVRLRVVPLANGLDYFLTVRNVADLKTNSISPLSNKVAIVRPPGRVVFPFSGVTRVWNAAEARARGVTLPSNWREPDFDDSDLALWVPGRGMLHCDTFGGLGPGLGDQMCSVFNHPTLVSNRSVFYLRSHFTTDTNITPKCVQLQYSLGNPSWFGAGFYLNGLAIHHQDPYIINSAADGANAPDGFLPTQPAWESSSWIAARNVRRGDNVVATEVIGPFNMYFFALQVGEGPQAPLPLPPRLSIIASTCPATSIRREPCVVTATWPSADYPGWMLQAATNLSTGPWTNIATNSPCAVEMVPGVSQFFRLHDSGSF